MKKRGYDTTQTKALGSFLYSRNLELFCFCPCLSKYIRVTKTFSKLCYTLSWCMLSGCYP